MLLDDIFGFFFPVQYEIILVLGIISDFYGDLNFSTLRVWIAFQCSVLVKYANCFISTFLAGEKDIVISC